MANLQKQSDAINQLIQGINKMVVDYCQKYSTMIYDGIVISNNFDGKWNIRYNGEVHAMKPYKTSPTVGEMVKVFIPNGNQNLGFILSSVGGGGGGGGTGENGATFYPSVSEDGILSWTNDKGLPNPPSVNIMGPQGEQGADATINGVNTLEIVEGENISLSQSGNTLIISATGNTTSVNVGTTTTGEPGTDAQVTNSGTSQNVVLNFTIPRGADGTDGTNGTDGQDGATFTPSVSAEGVLSWTNNGGLPNPDPVNIKGEQGEQGEQGVAGQDATINGQNAINIVAGENITINQQDGTLTISATGGGTGGGMSAEIIVTPNVEFTSVTATSPSNTVYNGTFANGIWTIKVDEFGEYVVNGYGEYPDSTNVTVLVCQQYEIELGTAPVLSQIYGVMWDRDNPNTQLTRLTSTNDPNGLVNTSITESPTPAVGNTGGSSPFDTLYPWSLMEEWNVIDGVPTYKKGDSEFSRTLYDTMVYVPEFWVKVVDGTQRCYYVASEEVEGFEKHPGSGKYIGRYEASGGYVSKSGLIPLVSITRATARTGARNKGAGWNQVGFDTEMAWRMLYLVEYADWNSQTAIGRGYVDGNSVTINSGATDTMVYHTGRASGTDGKTAVQYRGIENPWGNVCTWCDGINFDNNIAFICLNTEQWEDDTSSNYTNAEVALPSNGYIKDLGFSPQFQWALIPSSSGGSTLTYIPDYISFTSGWRVLGIGGYRNNSSYAGVLNLYGTSSTYVVFTFGTRLQFDPTTI